MTTIETLLGLMIRYMLLKVNNNNIDDGDIQLDEYSPSTCDNLHSYTILNEFLCHFQWDMLICNRTPLRI